jgi:fucose permease
MKAKSKFYIYFPCYFSFLVNGAIVLMIGTILPYIIEEAGINYSAAGSILSAFAIGNFLASFVYPVIQKWIGKRAASTLLSALIPVCLLGVTYLPPLWVMNVLFLCAGIGRGAVSITNNAVINDRAKGQSFALNMLHMTFAAGAFLSPFLTNGILFVGGTWKTVVYVLATGSVLAAVSYGLFLENEAAAQEKQSKGNWDFAKQPAFYIFGVLLFFYLGVENCVNGWFVTYFKSMGIMSSAYANTLVSITWIMVMCGRLLTAWLSKKIDSRILILTDCVMAGVFFVILIATMNLSVITIAIAGLGFFFAGIYPTCVAGAGKAVSGSTEGMSMLLAIAALGGIITPKFVGMVADRLSMSAAIVMLLINVIGMFVMAVIQFVGKGKKE